MTDTMQVPANVAAIIAAKLADMTAEAKENEIKRAEEKAAAVAMALGIIADKLSEVSSMLPPWIVQYEATADCLNMRDERNLEWIGTRQQRVNSLFFKIPGLSTIEFDFDGNQWRSSYAGWNEEEPETMPYFFFGRDSWWRVSLDYTLIEAQESGKEYQRLLGVREKTLAEMTQREEENRQPKPESVVEEKQEDQPAHRWAAEAIEGQLLYMCAEGDQNGIAEMQVRATLLVVEQLQRIADFFVRNDGENGILCQIRDGRF